MADPYEVVLLRHGETHGYDADHGLTARGEEQARERGVALAAELAPGTSVVMPHARTARGIATAVVLRETLVGAVGPGVTVGELYPEPWFDNLRFALHGEVVDASVAVAARLALGDADLPHWAAEYARFDSDYREIAARGGPIGHWIHNPTLYFEPPQIAAYRFWSGITALAPEGSDEQRVAVVATHSAPMRAFVSTAFGHDPGEPENLEPIRVSVAANGSPTVRFRDLSLALDAPPPLPPWFDDAWLEKYGRS
jgi:broad specificity phosphatase PhoE